MVSVSKLDGLHAEQASSPVGHVILNCGVGDLPSNQPFECEDGVTWVDNRLTFPGKPNQALPVFCEAHH